MTGSLNDAAPVAIDAIGVTELDLLIDGCQLYGPSIAGHDLSVLTTFARHLIHERGPVRLHPATGLAPETNCASILAMGSMSAISELMPTGEEAGRAVSALEERLGREVAALFPLDAANVNAIVPLTAAAQLGLDLVDCDAMGRIFPGIHQTSLHLAGLPLGPVVAASPTGDTVTVDADGARADAVLRALLDEIGGWAFVAMHPCTAAQLATSALHGTISRLVTVGSAMAEARSARELIRRLGAATGSRVLGRGFVAAVEHGTKRQQVSLPSLPSSIAVVERSSSGHVLQLEVQNEIVLAMIDGKAAAAIPDNIFLVDSRTGHLLGVDQVRPGDQVDVLTLPAADVWHTEPGLALAGPEAFGIPIEHPRARQDHPRRRPT